jgi:flagellar biosynthesis protein FlhG
MQRQEAVMMHPPNPPLHRDQADGLREWVAQSRTPRLEPSTPTHVVAIASGKGGVGKTQVAANLSIALAARGHRVVLFDMDLGLANADIVLGVDAPSSWADVLRGRRAVEDVVVEAPGNIAFVPGSSGIAQLADLSEFERHQLRSAMEHIERQYEVAVLDCGAGISRNVVSFAAGSDTFLVVTTPEPTSITDAYATIKAYAQEQGRGTTHAHPMASVGVIINHVESKREGRETFERLASVAARFLHMPITDFGYILRDDHVPAAVRQRVPFILRYPRCSAATCVMASAARIARELGHVETDKGLFQRVMNMFM